VCEVNLTLLYQRGLVLAGVQIVANRTARRWWGAPFPGFLTVSPDFEQLSMALRCVAQLAPQLSWLHNSAGHNSAGSTTHLAPQLTWPHYRPHALLEETGNRELW
jgi:hypothetical protein